MSIRFWVVDKKNRGFLTHNAVTVVANVAIKMPLNPELKRKEINQYR